MTITDAQLSLAEGVAAHYDKDKAFPINPEYLLALIREVRECRAKAKQQK